MSDSIIKIGLEGMQNGMAQAVRDAQAVVDAMGPQGDQDPVGPMIRLKQDLRQVQASAKIIKKGEELQDEVLDILA